MIYSLWPVVSEKWDCKETLKVRLQRDNSSYITRYVNVTLAYPYSDGQHCLQKIKVILSNELQIYSFFQMA